MTGHDAQQARIYVGATLRADVHRLLRIRCAELHISLAEGIRIAVERWLEESEKP